jgi:23S rRNA pseudouridine1911/1915/1917 synthase
VAVWVKKVMKKELFTVSEDLSGLRLDLAVSRLSGELTRARVQKLLAEGLVLVNGAACKPNYRVRPGDSIDIAIPSVREAKAAAEEIELDILYEDNHILVLNKQKGLVVHPAAGHKSGTLVNALLHHCTDLSGIGGEARPGIVHRLDKDTSGVLVVAKNDRAHLLLSQQFKEHSITREYVAIAHGSVSKAEGVIEGAIARHPRDRKKMAVVPPARGRHAVTHFFVLERLGSYTFLRLRLETGRTHQIRVHLAAVGHPVLGDPVYGPKKPHIKYAGQALHACLLGFIHPANGEFMEFRSEPPQDFQNLLTFLREGGGKVNEY